MIGRGSFFTFFICCFEVVFLIVGFFYVSVFFRRFVYFSLGFSGVFSFISFGFTVFG